MPSSPEDLQFSVVEQNNPRGNPSRRALSLANPEKTRRYSLARVLANHPSMVPPLCLNQYQTLSAGSAFPGLSILDDLIGSSVEKWVIGGFSEPHVGCLGLLQAHTAPDMTFKFEDLTGSEPINPKSHHVPTAPAKPCCRMARARLRH